MISVATFDILPSDVILSDIFDELTDETSFSGKFERMGFDTQYMVFNMGTMFLVFCFNCSVLILYLLLALIKGHVRWARVVSKKMHKVLFWRWQIIFI